MTDYELTHDPGYEDWSAIFDFPCQVSVPSKYKELVIAKLIENNFYIN
jgi:hypothetical protein